MSTRTRRRFIVAFFTGALFVLGVAFAQWVANGTGSGNAKAAVAEPLTTLDSSAFAAGDLYPGGAGDLYLTLSNPNPYPVVVNSVIGNGTITSDTGGCDASNHGVTYTDQTGLSLGVPANGSATHVLAGSVAMALDSANACQGATFTIPVALSGFSGDSAPELSTFCRDADGDGFGDPNDCLEAESAPDGYIADNTDCNDEDAAVHPGAEEVLNGIDDNCDGQIDEGLEPLTTYCRDADGDGWGDPNDCVEATSQPDGYVDNNGDCADTDPNVNPGAPEIPGNFIDDNCDGQVDENNP